MLIHQKCGAPVEVIESEEFDPDAPQAGVLLRFGCSVCKEEILDWDDLYVEDSLTLLNEACRKVE